MIFQKDKEKNLPMKENKNENDNKFNKSYMNSIDISIESLFSETILELIPTYSIKIRDILDSLDPKKNEKNCKILFEKKFMDKDYNHFFTLDTFLHYEIYDNKNILPNLKNFMENYHNFINENFKNWKATFIPLIVGIYNIKFLKFDKVVVLYRHPLAFSPFLLFKYWINVALTDESEKISISTNYAEVIDLKEIEIKDNIKLHKEDYREVCEIIKNDFNFLKSLNFNSSYMINVFILNEVQQFLTHSKNNSIYSQSVNLNISQVKNNDVMNSSTNRDSKKSQQDDKILNLRQTEQFRELTIKQAERTRKEHGSDVLSILDKLLTNYLVNSRYVIKIYFSDLFSGGQQSHLDVEKDNLYYSDK